MLPKALCSWQLKISQDKGSITSLSPVPVLNHHSGKKSPDVPNDFSMKSPAPSSPQFSHLSHGLTRSALSPKCFPDLWAHLSPIMIVLGLFSLVYFVWGFKLFHNNMVQEYQPGEKTDSECSSFRVSWEEVSALFPQVGCTLRLWKLHD